MAFLNEKFVCSVYKNGFENSFWEDLVSNTESMSQESSSSNSDVLSQSGLEGEITVLDDSMLNDCKSQISKLKKPDRNADVIVIKKNLSILTRPNWVFSRIVPLGFNSVGSAFLKFQRLRFGDMENSIGILNFLELKNVVSVIITNGINRIYSYAFRNCRFLKCIVVSDESEELIQFGSGCFENCYNLSDVIIVSKCGNPENLRENLVRSGVLKSVKFHIVRNVNELKKCMLCFKSYGITLIFTPDDIKYAVKAYFK